MGRRYGGYRNFPDDPKKPKGPKEPKDQWDIPDFHQPKPDRNFCSMWNFFHKPEDLRDDKINTLLYGTQ